MTLTAGGINITPAHVLRHTPPGARTQGREAALVDIGQDLLLRHLHHVGLIDELVFKGGTALRKLYAGNAGRFSLDLDFSIRDIGTTAESILELLEEEVAGLTLGPFDYGIVRRRGKRHLTIRSVPLGSTETLSSKLDVSSPPWLTPVARGWVPMPIHAQYGPPTLPSLPVVRLEENLAEKISRLNRATPARDMYDLHWVAQHEVRRLDRPLVRRLAVLKIWVDTCGVTAADGTAWLPAHSGGAFDPQHWLRLRSEREYDEEDIGTLAVPPPPLRQMSTEVSASYAFLGDLDADEQRLSAARESERALALRLLAELPDGRLNGIGLR